MTKQDTIRGGGWWPYVTVLLVFAATPEILLAADTTDPPTGDGLLEILPLVCSALSIGILAALWKTPHWRPPRIEGRPMPTPWRPSTLQTGLTFLAMLLVAPLCIQLARASLPGLDRMDPIERLGVLSWAGAASGLLLAAPIGVIALRRPRPPQALRPLPGWLIVPIGALGFLVTFPLVQTTMYIGGLTYTMINGQPPEQLGHETLQLLRDVPHDLGWWLMATCVVIGAPWQEEVLFRGMLQQTFRTAGVGSWLAIVVTAAIFTMMHVSVIPAASRMSVLPGLLVLAIGLGVLRERTGRISTCVIAHAIFNLANLSLSFAVE